MSLGDASVLLLKAGRSKDVEAAGTEALAKDIADILGSLALALVSAAALIRQRICNLNDYCLVFETQRQGLMANPASRLPSSHANDVYAT